MNNNDQQYEETQQAESVTYASATATALVSDDQQNRSLVTDIYAANQYVYVPDTNLMSAQTLPANFFPPAYFPTNAPTTLDFLWAPWTFDMLHGNDLNSPLVDYHSHPFPGSANSSNQLHNRLPPLQTGFSVPAEFPLQSFMTRSSGNIGGGATYGTRSQTSGRKGGRRPREIEDKDQFDLSQEDKEKRAKRRERNKQAAARCRKRRIDLMENLQEEVERLKNENNARQMKYERLNQQYQELLNMFRGHNCQANNKGLPQGLHHIESSAKNQQLVYGHDMMQHLKMEPDAGMDPHLQPDLDDFLKNDQMGGDESSSPISFPITTSSMIINNDPVISHATFDASSNKHSKLDQNLLISDSNETPAFSRPNTLSLPSYCSSDLTSNLPSLNTPSAGLSGYLGGSEFSLLNQQTFLTPMTLGPVAVTSSSANTPPHGELRQL